VGKPLAIKRQNYLRFRAFAVLRAGLRELLVALRAVAFFLGLAFAFARGFAFALGFAFARDEDFLATLALAFGFARAGAFLFFVGIK